MKKTLLFSLASLLLLAACDTTDPNEADELLVVEAFLYAGEPIDDIHLSTVIPLDSEDSLGTPINDADVRLIKDGITYALTPSGSDGSYFYSGTDLSVETDDVFRLEVDRGGTHITAETTVPPAPTGVTMAVTEVRVPSAGEDFRASRTLFQSLFQENTLSVTWDNPEAESYFVTLETPASDAPDYLLPEFVREIFSGFRLVTQPTTANFFDIPILSLEVTGTYQTTVYRINQEYADLYENREQDSRDLNEPPTNVEGGLGVFSAFHGGSVTFRLVRE